MCHGDDSRPPAPPVPLGDMAEQGELELTAADGNRLRAFWAAPATPNGSNLVLLPDLRGLHPFYETLAGLYARLGFRTVAIDFYGRTAGTSRRTADFDGPAHLKRLEAGHVDADVAAAAALLREDGEGPLFTLGFCIGGSHSWRQAATGLGVAGAIGFYGRPRVVGDAADSMAAPLLMLVAGSDRATPVEESEAMAARVRQAGGEAEMHVYDGAPHSFFDKAFADWEAACTDAWRRILDFTTRHAG